MASIKPKPIPPTRDAIDADIASALAALGASNFEVRHPEDAVYDVLVSWWRKHKTPPTIVDMCKVLNKRRELIHDHLHHLSVIGRIKRIRRGVYVPIIQS